VNPVLQEVEPHVEPVVVPVAGVGVHAEHPSSHGLHLKVPSASVFLYYPA